MDAPGWLAAPGGSALSRGPHTLAWDRCPSWDREWHAPSWTFYPGVPSNYKGRAAQVWEAKIFSLFQKMFAVTVTQGPRLWPSCRSVPLHPGPPCCPSRGRGGENPGKASRGGCCPLSQPGECRLACAQEGPVHFGRLLSFCHAVRTWSPVMTVFLITPVVPCPPPRAPPFTRTGQL